MSGMYSQMGRMLGAMAWANRQSLGDLSNCPAARPEATPLLSHLLAAERVWLSRLEGRNDGPPVWPELGLEECQALATENEARFAAFLANTDESGLAATIQYRNTRGEEFTSSALDILTHVVIHGAYHRGQIAKLVGRAGGPASNSDFITFARLVETPSP